MCDTHVFLVSQSKKSLYYNFQKIVVLEINANIR
jgi:hypothetical protein